MNDVIRQINSSASMDLIAKAKALKEAGANIISLAGGEPDFSSVLHLVSSLDFAVIHRFYSSCSLYSA